VHVGQDGRQLGHHRPEAKVAVRASSQQGALFVRHRAIEKGRCWRRLKTDHLCRMKIDQGLLLA
jgi:hypothetical protein